ncbi:MAG: hypothetical protein IJW17_02235 [Lentisphaeria bacterium]|nr:hypothetical protein [Lentisphaeria bacterium]
MRRIKAELYLAFVALLLTSGCIIECGIEDLKGNGNVAVDNFPVKFYINSIQHRAFDTSTSTWKNPSKTDEDYFLAKSEDSKIKRALLRYYPQLFSNKEENALKADIIFYGDKKNIDLYQYPAGEQLWLFFTLGTLGLIPGKETRPQLIRIEIEVAGVKRMTEYKLIRLNKIGSFGTNALIDSPPNPWFYIESGLNADGEPVSIKQENVKDFVKLVVHEFLRLPRREMMELYFSQKTREIKLLE